MKKCIKCNELKELSEFSKNKRYEDGLYYYCKQCKSLLDKAYRDANREKLIEKRREHYVANKASINAKNTANYEANREERIMHMREYHSANKDKAQAYQEKYRKDNTQWFKDYRKTHIVDAKVWRKKNRAKHREQLREYRSTEYGRIVTLNSTNKRRALKASSSDDTLTLNSIYPLSIELEELLSRQEYKCNNCNCDIGDNRHLDHHIPLSKGGTHSINNVVWLCPTCNLSKSDKMPDTLLLL